MLLFSSNLIRDKVLEAVEAKINEVEVLYKQDVSDLKAEFAAREASLLDGHVNSILSKIL